MRTGVIMQVRLGSSRLPKKAILELAGKTIIEHAMGGLASLDLDVFVLATDRPSASVLEPLARKCGYELYAGSEENVLKRYLEAARKWDIDTIIRATGDNPLVSAELARIALDLFHSEKADFAALDDMPLGTGVEIIRRTALEEAGREASDPYEWEHVSPFLYNRANRYRIVRRPSPENMRLNQRVTLDTAEDFVSIEKIFTDLYNGKPIETSQLVHYFTQGRSAEKNTVCSFHKA